jgi:2-phosphosulfolactate phosphatase
MDRHLAREATRMEIEAHFLPNLTEADDLAGATVVVIDVLRATTTIIHALAAGAADVIPCLEVDEARQIAQRLGNDAVLGGERGGVRIDGFHLGNSPEEYTPQKIGGKTVVFTTTNGTRAMRLCSQARRVLIGAFVNFSAVCGALADESAIHLLCAGTDGEITREDVLFAGAVVDDLSRRAGVAILLNDQAEIAADAWRSAARGLTQGTLLTDALRSSRGGRNLIEVGHEHDIEIAATIDKFHLVPKLDLSAWRITL